MNRNLSISLIVLGLFLASIVRAKTTASKDTPKLDAKLSAEDKLAAINQRSMVTPAPSDFKPESVDRKISLKLILEKPTLRVGEAPRFRLEITNVGRKAIDYQEYSPSIFVKDGGLLDSPTIHFYSIDSRKKRTELMPLSVPRPASKASRSRQGIRPPAGSSEAEKEKWLEETNAMGEARSTFKVRLLPGETLRSIGDENSPIENFKTLYTDDSFDSPGTYQLQVKLDDRPEPMSKRYIEVSLRTGSTLKELRDSHARQLKDALGPVSSNAATFKVTR